MRSNRRFSGKLGGKAMGGEDPSYPASVTCSVGAKILPINSSRILLRGAGALILHLVLVALCVWHLTVCSGYGEARMRFVLPLIVFMPGAAVLYLLSAREGTVPPDTIKTGSSSPVYFEHRLGFRDGGRSRWGLPRRRK